LVGSVAINLGTNIIKLAHNKRSQLPVPDEEKPPITKFREWIVGMVIFSVGNVLNFVSFGFAAQSLLAALGCIQFVSNVFIAYFLLKEKITRIVLIATTCIVGGCILLVLFGNQSSESFTVQELIALYSKPAYVVYLTMLGVFVFGSYIVYLHGKAVVRKYGANAPPFWAGVLPIAYSIFSALLGTQSVLFSKSMSVILRKTFSGDNQLRFWYTWVVLPLFIFTAVFWVTRLNKGLRMFPAMLIVPMMQICWTLFSIVSGMLYFQEYSSFTTISWIMFPLGVSIVFVGVFLLTKSGRRGAKSDPELAGGEEEDDTLSTQKQLAIMSHAADISVAGGGVGPGTKGEGADGKDASLGLLNVGEPLSTGEDKGGEGAGRGKGCTLGETEIGGKAWSGLDSLRFTSLASSAFVGSPHSPLQGVHSPTGGGGGGPSGGSIFASSNHANSRRNANDGLLSPKRNQEMSFLGASMTSLGDPSDGNLTDRNYNHLDVDSNAATIRSDEGSMMDTIRKSLRTVQNKLGADFGLDSKTAKQLLGFGDDSSIPAISLFGGVPVVDMTMKMQKHADRQQHQLIEMRPRIRAYEPAVSKSMPSIKEFDATDPTELVRLTHVAIEDGDGDGSLYPHVKAKRGFTSPLPLSSSSTAVGSSSGNSGAGGGGVMSTPRMAALKAPVDFVVSAARTPLRKLQPAPGSMERILDKAVDGVLNSLIQNQPSYEIHKAIREKQGYGSLDDKDEDTEAMGTREGGVERGGNSK